MDLLLVAEVSKKEKEIYTVRQVSFTQRPLQKIAIAGETGSGKTTLLKMIGGLAQPDEGQILFQQKNVRGPNDQLIPGHAGIAYLSQHFELRNNYWVHEILAYANELTPPEADNLYKICRIDHLLNRRTDQLSGGEKQRIALARLLIGAPKLLLMDEPFSNLDAVHKAIIKNVVADITGKLGISCILVSHDAPDTLPWADTILVMKDGRLLQTNTPENIYRRPVNEYCAGLFGDYNLIDEPLSEKLLPPHTSFPAGKKLLVRPEQFVLNNSNDGLQGVLQQIEFMGSFYMLQIDTGLQLLKVRTTGEAFTRGQAVNLALSSGNHWWI